MKTLFLHIGTPKTGTTSLQEFCHLNREAFLKYSYCYPKINAKYPGVRSIRNGAFLVGRIWDEEGKRDRVKEQELYELGMEQVKEAFETSQTVVLSDEHLWWGTSSHRKGLWKQLKKMADHMGWDVKIVVYLRRQDDYISSHWNQFVKNNVRTTTWEEHVKLFMQNESMRLNYATKLDGIAKVFGKDAIIVRRFDFSYFEDQSIYKDFMKVIGLGWKEEFLLPEETNNNQGLKGNTFEIKRILNEIPDMDEEVLRQLGMVLKNCSKMYGSEYRYHMFSKEERAELMQQFQEENDRVAREYIQDGEPLFPEITKELPKWTWNNPYLHQDIIRFWAMAYSELFQKQQLLEQEVKALKQQKTVTERIYNKYKNLRKRIS